MQSFPTAAEALAAPGVVLVTLDAQNARWLALEEGEVTGDLPPGRLLVPGEVTMRQARLALLAVGKLDAVNAAIDAMPEPQRSAAHIEWEYGSSVQRHSNLVTALGPALGLTENELDMLFASAVML